MNANRLLLAAGGVLLYAICARADTLTVTASLPYERIDEHAQNYVTFPGFNPAMGTLTRVDVTSLVTYETWVYLFCGGPIGADCSGPVEIGACAGFGYIDAAGYVGLAGVCATQVFNVVMQRGDELNLNVAGSATGSNTTTGARLDRFIGAGNLSFPAGRMPFEDGNARPSVSIDALDAGAHFTIVYTFTPPVPTPPVLVAPEDNADNVVPAPNLAWIGPRVNHTYTVTIATDAALTDVVHSVAELHESTYTVPQGVLSGCSMYFWAVDAINSAGSARSTTFSFSTLSSADFDQDGFLTGADYDLFVQAFEAGEMTADFDRDGFITGLDFDLYVLAFEAGC